MWYNISTMAAKLYTVIAKINGETVTKKTDDLDKTLAGLCPDWLHTDVFITVKKGKVESERHLSLRNAKRMFRDDFVREVFINNLLLS